MRPTVGADPIQVFRSWLMERQRPPNDLRSAHYATLSTVDMSQSPPQPCSRTISVADITAEGKFVFTTTRTSGKAQQLAHNSACSLCFNWFKLKKQVRVEGNAKRADDVISDRIWSNKDRAYWIWACSTQQFREIDHIDVFAKRMSETAAKYEHIQNIPRPSNWQAFIIDPVMIEFWRGHNEGLHHRHRYERSEFGQMIEPWRYSMIEP